MKRVRKCSKIIVLLLSFFLFTAIPASSASAAGRGTYQILSDLVYSFKMNGLSSFDENQRLLAELREENPELASAWQNIMDYWFYVNTDFTVNYDILPDGMPTDDSLCIIVLGYQLNSDGTMAEELLGRCRTALSCAEKYPNAYVAVTGGGTAYGNRAATEADKMAEWLIANGLEEGRLIVENRSLTTVENARFTSGILFEQYPQVKYAAIVTSDYHLPLGSLLFHEQFVLSAYQGEQSIAVISNAGYKAPWPEVDSIYLQAGDVWQIASVLDEIN